MSKPMTALQFARRQVSWATHRQELTADAIEERLAVLRADGLTDEELDGDTDDAQLLDLYDDEFYWARLKNYMSEQVEYLRERAGIPTLFATATDEQLADIRAEEA